MFHSVLITHIKLLSVTSTFSSSLHSFTGISLSDIDSFLVFTQFHSVSTLGLRLALRHFFLSFLGSSFSKAVFCKPCYVPLVAPISSSLAQCCNLTLLTCDKCVPALHGPILALVETPCFCAISSSTFLCHLVAALDFFFHDTDDNARSSSSSPSRTPSPFPTIFTSADFASTPVLFLLKRFREPFSLLLL